MNGKSAFVTGASEGIGRAFAKRLAFEGYAVTAVARNEARLKELLDELGGSGHEYLVADLGNTADLARVSAKVSEKHYDLVINNAGFGIFGEFVEVPLARSQEMLRVNCGALMELSHAYLLKAKAGDALINVSSVVAFLPLPANGLYAATKAFVTSFSEALWFENKARDVYVMGLCPGFTTTKFAERAKAVIKSERHSARPGVIGQTADQVVDAAMQGLKARRRPTVVCGFYNKIMSSVYRVLSRRVLVSLLGNVA